MLRIFFYKTKHNGFSLLLVLLILTSTLLVLTTLFYEAALSYRVAIELAHTTTKQYSK